MHEDVALEPKLPEDKLKSTGSPNVALEHPREEPKEPEAVRKLYHSFTGALQPVRPSRTKSGKHGGWTGDSDREEGGRGGENVGIIPVGIYGGRMPSNLLGAVDIRVHQVSLE